MNVKLLVKNNDKFKTDKCIEMALSTTRINQLVI